MTGFSAARIRKWQQRYDILNPVTHENGYNYYDNQDLFLLKNIKIELENGQSLSEIIQNGRENILSIKYYQSFSAKELNIIEKILSVDFVALQEIFDELLLKSNFRSWIKKDIGQVLQMVGRAWEYRLLSTADEHAFSRWFFAYFDSKILKIKSNDSINWLVVTFPTDEHELGSFIFYGLLCNYGVSAKFCGRLPEDELIKELYSHDYRKLSISVVMPKREKELFVLKEKLRKKFPKLGIHFGGYGYRNRIT